MLMCSNPYHAGLFAYQIGSVTPFVRWIEDYPLLDRLKMPSHIGSYDGKRDPNNFLHLFEGAIRMQKWLMLVACHKFTYTLKESARIWWNSKKVGSILNYEDLKGKFRSYFSQQKRVTKTHLAVHNIKKIEGESVRAFTTRGQRSRDRFSPYRVPNHGLLSNLSKRPKEILATEKVDRSFEQPPRMLERRRSQDMSKFCYFYEDYMHDTNDCRQLRNQIKEAVRKDNNVENGNGSLNDPQSHQISHHPRSRKWLPSDLNGRRRRGQDNILRRRRSLLLSKDALRFKNAGATYKRLVYKVFNDQIGRNLEAYVDDTWTQEAIATLQEMKNFVENLPTLIAPIYGKVLMMYLAASTESISAALFARKKKGQQEGCEDIFRHNDSLGSSSSKPLSNYSWIEVIHLSSSLVSTCRTSFSCMDLLARTSTSTSLVRCSDIMFQTRDDNNKDTSKDFLIKAPPEENEKEIQRKIDTKLKETKLSHE
nr:hypothetical protein [Tanacetum cinerariifolium]